MGVSQATPPAYDRYAGEELGLDPRSAACGDVVRERVPRTRGGGQAPGLAIQGGPLSPINGN